MIISPCISICKTDPVTGFCYGCARNKEEVKIWKDESTSEKWKENNLKEIQTRMCQITISKDKRRHQNFYIR